MVSTAIVAVTFALLIAGVVGSLVPVLPGALFSLLGVAVHWWASGYTTPGLFGLVVFVCLGAGALFVDLFGGAIAASQGGASNLTVMLAVVVSIGLSVVTGPLGVLVGIPLTVFVVEYYRAGDSKDARQAAFVTTVGMLTSNLVQALLTGSILVGFAVVVFL